jgi:hypothetical protein
MGFIEIANGLWYDNDISNGAPYSTRRIANITGGRGFDIVTDGEMKPISVNLSGYYVVKINSKAYPWHRLVWEHFYGPIPEGMQIDHINGVRDDNRLENLRLATNSQNGMNTKKYKNNTSGVRGVRWNKSKGKWEASINVNGKTKYLGSFKDIKKAAEVYNESAKLYHGEFRRL